MEGMSELQGPQNRPLADQIVCPGSDLVGTDRHRLTAEGQGGGAAGGRGHRKTGSSE